MDIIIFLAALAVGSFAAALAYYVGGRSWTIKFAIRGPLLASGKRDRAAGFKPRSGLYAEWAVQTLILTITLFVNFVTPDASFVGVITENLRFFLGLLSITSLLVILYGLYISRKASVEGKASGRGQLFAKRLARGYIPYTIFSIINLSAIIMVVALIYTQTLEHYQQYKQADMQLDALIVEISAPALTPDSGMVLVEHIYIKVREGASFMVDQINTLVLLVFCSFALQYAVKYTPISQVFEPDAVMQFELLLWLSIAFIAVYAWSVHFFVYETFFGDALLAMDQNRAMIAGGGWEMLEKFNSHYLDLVERQGLTGFMLSLTSDRGGLLLALGAAGWIMDKQREKKKLRRYAHD